MDSQSVAAFAIVCQTYNSANKIYAISIIKSTLITISRLKPIAASICTILSLKAKNTNLN